MDPSDRVQPQPSEASESQNDASFFDRHKGNTYFRVGLVAFLVISLCIIEFQLISLLPEFFSFFGRVLRSVRSILYGIGIAYLLDPVVIRLEKLMMPFLEKKFSSPERAKKAARGLSIAVSIVLLLLLIYALLAMVIPQLIDSITTIVVNLPSYYNTISDWAQELLPESMQDAAETGDEFLNNVYNYVSDWLTSTLLPAAKNLASSFTSSIVGMLRFFINVIIGLIVSVYLLTGKERFLAQIKKAGYAVLGSKRGGYVSNICSYANRMFGSFIGGKIIDSIIIGILCLLGLMLLRVPYAMLISIIVCVTNIIPFFGPYIGAIPSALLLLVVDPIKCLTFIIFILILQQIDGNIIGPAILGDATGLENFWVIFAILLFGGLWGFIGMVVGVPTFAVLYAMASDFINRALSRRGMPSDTDMYKKWNYPPRPDSSLIHPAERKEHWSIRALKRFWSWLRGKISSPGN